MLLRNTIIYYAAAASAFLAIEFGEVRGELIFQVPGGRKSKSKSRM